MFQEKKTRWRSLENTAKIFPATSGKKDERVFRFACVLKEPVIGETLQEALDLALEEFSMFQCVLRKGFFWNYLEESEETAIVRKEYKQPCSQIYVRDQKSLLFEVTYYKNRINFETYHALTDGTGALHFLRALVYHYLALVYPGQISYDAGKLQLIQTDEDKEEDSFWKYYDRDTKRQKIKKYKACQLHGRKMDYGQMQLTEGIVSTKQLLLESRKRGTTITVLLTALYLKAIAQDLTIRQKKRPVVLMIPVNLRNYYPSESMRNFFGWIDIGYSFSESSDELNDVIAVVDKMFKKELQPDKIAARMYGLMDFEMNPFVRVLPLELKLYSMQMGAYASRKEETAVFSNVGKVDMPKECRAYIDFFDVFTSTPKQELAMCSYGDRMVFSFTSAFANQRVETCFFKGLEELGVPVRVIDEKESFPDLKKENSRQELLVKCFNFGCVAAAVICGVLNGIINPDFKWSLYVLGAVLCGWVLTTVAVRKRRDMMKNIVWQTVLISIGLLIWDFATGWRGWSVNIGFPAAVAAALVAMLIVTAVFRLPSPRYMIYFFMICLLGMLPLLLLAAGVLTSRIPAMICSGASLLVLLALLIFQREALFNELAKKFHINRMKG